MFFLLSVEIKEVKILRHGFLPAVTVNVSQSALISLVCGNVSCVLNE